MGLKAKLYFLTALAIGAPSAAHALSGRVPHPGPDVGPIDMATQAMSVARVGPPHECRKLKDLM